MENVEQSFLYSLEMCDNCNCINLFIEQCTLKSFLAEIKTMNFPAKRYLLYIDFKYEIENNNFHRNEATKQANEE